MTEGRVAIPALLFGVRPQSRTAPWSSSVTIPRPPPPTHHGSVQLQVEEGRRGRAGAAERPKQPGFIARLRAKLNRGDSWLTYDLANLLPGGKIDDAVLDELETRLIGADVGIETTEKILGGLRGKVARKELANLDALLAALRQSLLDIVGPVSAPLVVDEARRPYVILVVGVNGSGKTTTIGKLARRLHAAKAARSCSPPATRSAPRPSSSCRSGASATACR